MRHTLFILILAGGLLIVVVLACGNPSSNKPDTRENSENQTTAPAVPNSDSNANSSGSALSEEEQIENDSGFVPKEVEMDSNFRRKLNTFFSNFSEVYVQPFIRDQIDNEELIHFGFLHNYINRPDKLEITESLEGKLAAAYVEAAVEKYFGRKIEKHESIEYIRYENGYYYMGMADGEAYTFSQITKLVEIEDDLFVANVNVYRAPNWWEGDPHGTVDEWRRQAEEPDEVPELIAQMTATIRKISFGGEDRYILIEYLETISSE